MAHRNARRISFPVLVILMLLCLSQTAWTDTQPAADSEDPGFYYTIQKGDTLWDLSRKFYNSQWDWPGLWEMNKDIKNPHWIYPGKKIRVYLKQAAQAMPEPPAPEQPQEEPGPPEIVPIFSFNGMDRIGFVRSVAEKKLGTILREREGRMMISARDTVYINPAEKDSLVPGQTYLIFNVEKVSEKINNQRFKGVKHITKAKIQILENHPEYSVGLVTASWRDAGTGDMLMAYTPMPSELVIETEPAPIDAHIVCSEENTVMVNDYRIAFIDKGAPDQLKPGQIYTISQPHENTEKSFLKKDLPFSPLDAGRLIVLRAEDISATVMILSSKRDIHPGDMVN